jgi:hypothetical protein
MGDIFVIANMNVQRYWKLIIVVLLVGGYTIYLKVGKHNRENELLNDHSMASGKIGNISTDKRVVFTYSFFVAGKKYEAETRRTYLDKENCKAFSEKYFPVIYAKGDPDNNRILITKKDFTEFGLPWPDSLKWVFQKTRDYWDWNE